jgi:FMN reductase
MTTPLDIVAVVGSTAYPSRTRALVDALVAALEQRLAACVHIVQLGEIARALGQALTRDELAPAVEAELRRIESAGLLIAAAPVYRGSFPAHFKHLFDLVGQDALVDKPVLLAATGGSERHALVLEHQWRPLFSFFQSLTLPIGVYASNADIERAVEGYQIATASLQARIALATDRALPYFAAHRRLPLRRAA